MFGQNMKGVQKKLVRGLLDTVVLQLLKTQPMHGYQIITSLRKNFGVYFGPSTIYPLLCLLEEEGYIKSEWNLESDRPRKVYNITPQGSDILNFTEVSLEQIYRKLGNGFGKILTNDNDETLMSTLDPRKPSRLAL